MDKTDIIVKTQDMMRLGQYNSNPNLAAEDRVKLSGEYSFWTGILEDILTHPIFSIFFQLNICRNRLFPSPALWKIKSSRLL